MTEFARSAENSVPRSGRYYSLIDNREGNQSGMSLGSALLQRQTMGGIGLRPAAMSSQLSAKAWCVANTSEQVNRILMERAPLLTFFNLS